MGWVEVIFFYFFFWMGGGGYDYVAYQIKADDACSNMVANSLPTDTPSTRGWDQRSSHIFFSESSLVAYHIKGNRAQSTMKANMLSLHTPTTPGVGSKGHTFLF